MAKRHDDREPHPTPAEQRERDQDHAELERKVFEPQPAERHWTANIQPGVPVDCGCRPGRPCYFHLN